jgi:hypothetical protein
VENNNENLAGVLYKPLKRKEVINILEEKILQMSSYKKKPIKKIVKEDKKFIYCSRYCAGKDGSNVFRGNQYVNKTK